MEDPAKTHPIHASLELLDAMAKSSQLSELNTELDEDRRNRLERVFYLAANARKRVSRLKGVRANISVFTNMANSANAVRQELENYLANRNIGHIDNAYNQADQGLAVFLSQLPTGSITVEAETTLDSFRKSSRSAIGELKANEGILRQQISSFQQTIAEQEQRIGQAQEQIDSSRQDLATALATTESNFDSLKSTIEAEFGTLREGSRTALENELSMSTRLVDTKLEELEAKKAEAAAIVQSVGEILTTGTYRATAEKESTLANQYRLITIGLFAIGIAIVVSNYAMHAIAAWNGKSFEESPWLIAARFATALAVALPALYTARESARHRTNADRARQRELELTTLGPFIELLPAEKKAEIRDRLTDRYFGGEVDQHEVNPPINSENMTKFVEALAKLRPTT